MKNHELIKEEFASFKDRPDLYDVIKFSTAIEEPKQEEWLLNNYNYFFITYIDKEPLRYVYCEYVKDDQIKQVRILRNLLLEQNPCDFYDILFIVSHYDPLGKEEQLLQKHNPFLIPGISDGSILDSILKDSRGFLAYHYQIELIYRMITGCSPGKSQEFRKDLWKKREWAWAESEIICLNDGRNFKQIMDERMFSEFTCNPNYTGAMNLFECCFKID